MPAPTQSWGSLMGPNLDPWYMSWRWEPLPHAGRLAQP